MQSSRIFFKLIRYRSLSTVIVRCRSKSLLNNRRCVNIKELKWFHGVSVLNQKEIGKEEEKNSHDPRNNNRKKVLDLPPVGIWKGMTVQELSDALGKPINLMLNAMYPTFRKFYCKPEAKIDHLEIIHDIVKKFGRKYISVKKHVAPPKVKKVVKNQNVTNPENLVPRPPVITIMGHVDHGKTTLLDYLRKSSIVKSEFGGITQHIGAFSVLVDGKKITFIDTPGHAAFSSMRARGANVTDIVVLVVAADDGVMEQTIESIKMAQRAGVRILVAINKIDKPNVDIDKVKGELFNAGIKLEDFGGEVQSVPISALKGMNVDKLIESILVESELMELKGDPKGPVEGVIIESRKDQLKGKIASVLIKRGTLKKGKFLTADSTYARVKSLLDENSKEVENATPSTPVQVLGWKEVPTAGALVTEAKDDKEAKKIVAQNHWEEMEKKLKEWEDPIKKRAEELRAQYLEKKRLKKEFYAQGIKRRFYQDRSKQIVESEERAVNVLVKGDVAGSVEAIQDILMTYNYHDECKLEVVDCDVGNITENDVEMAEAFNAIIYGFNVTVPPDVKELANEKKVEIRFFNIIYRLIDDLKDELSLTIPPEDEEEIIGEADVLQNFLINEKKKKVPVAGCKCTLGVLKKENRFRLIRNEQILFDGKLKSLKHHKSEVESIKKDVNCGMMLDGFEEEFLPNDKIVCYAIKQVPQKTSWDPGF